MRERGLSEIVTTILIILIVIVAIGIIWVFIKPTFSSVDDQLLIDSYGTSLQIVRSSVSVSQQTKEVSFIVKRNGGDGTIGGFVVTLDNDVGNSEKHNFNTPLEKLESTSVYINYTNLSGTLKKISIFPLFYVNNKERLGSLTDEYAVVGTESSSVQSSENNGNSSGSNNETDQSVGFRNLAAETLVLYNTNDVEALDIANYYAQKRGIDPSHICGVAFQPGQYTEPKYILGARKKIVEQCICNLIPAAQRPSPCGVGNLDALSQVSPIDFMAVIKGVPTRIAGIGNDISEPSVDYYLSYLIYHDDNVFSPQQNGTESYPSNYILCLGNNMFGNSCAIDRYFPAINASIHKSIAYGRIEGLTKQRTMELIDRTVDAEQQGIKGNFLEGLSSLYAPTTRFLRDLTGSFNPACRDYLVSGGGQWPYSQCRYGGTSNGAVPGEPAATQIPIAINGGSLYANNPFTNIHEAFDGFYNMLKWHKSQTSCVELCKDFPTQIERDMCRANSKDYFKEINTDCVGVAPGFMGFKLRSFPVQYYGIYPAGWYSINDGSVEKSVPTILHGTSYQGNGFTDDAYLHFGSTTKVANPMCTLESGAQELCLEKIATQLWGTTVLSPTLQLTVPHTYVVRIRYRNPANPGGKMGARLVLENNTYPYIGPYTYLSIDAANVNWQTWEFRYTISSAEIAAVNDIRLDIDVSFQNNLTNYLDLDGIEVVDETTGQTILDRSVGSFNATQVGNTNNGDWAANVIDRLGGIAWWGSSSHYRAGGFAFSSTNQFMGAFYSGRTLGESTVSSAGSPGGGSSASSGLIYGDPLYNPVGVKVYLSNWPDQGPGPYNVPFVNQIPDNVHVLINAYDGAAKKSNTHWVVSYCKKKYSFLCSDSDWINVTEGTSAVFEKDVITLKSLINQITTRGIFLLRIKVWNLGEESDYLENFARFVYTPPELGDACLDDLSGPNDDGIPDGIVNSNDAHWLNVVCPNADVITRPECAKADFNYDEIVLPNLEGDAAFIGPYRTCLQ